MIIHKGISARLVNQQLQALDLKYPAGYFPRPGNLLQPKCKCGEELRATIVEDDSGVCGAECFSKYTFTCPKETLVTRIFGMHDRDYLSLLGQPQWATKLYDENHPEILTW
jgi:hypothetical protein